MYYFSDYLILCCLLTSGFFFGFYCKFMYVYDNLWTHWYTALGVVVALALACAWTIKKYKMQQYRFDHFYIIFYGLICFIISGCFMLAEDLDITFYFGFIGLVAVLIPSYSFISLRSSKNGFRPASVALGNTFYFAGLTIGFSLFNEFEPKLCGWIYLSLNIAVILGTVTNEILQHTGMHDYKHSNDLIFNLMNDEKQVFLPKKSIFAMFVGRPDFYLIQNRQWLVVSLSLVLMLERVFLFSPSFLQLTWSATLSYLTTQHLYATFLLHAIGCAIGAVLMLRYKPKLLYLMFGLIKITAMAAILGVYSDDLTGNCFLFLCFYYISMGVYSSITLQMVLECTPFLYTEVAVALAYSIELFVLELLKFETKVDNTWSILLGIGLSGIALTATSMILALFFLPRSEGLIDIRNKLLGIRRHPPIVTQTKIWNTNHFLHHDLQPDDMKTVTIDGNRMFQQYPREFGMKTQL